MSSTNGFLNYALTKSKPADFAKQVDRSVVKGKTAIVTGGASGIGQALVTELAKNGAFVVIADFKQEAGVQVEKDLTSQGYNVKFVRTDVTDWQSQLSAFKETLKLSGNQLDIVVPCAGQAQEHSVDQISPPEYKPGDDPIEPPVDVLKVNLIGVYYTIVLSYHYFRHLAGERKDQSWKPQLLLVASLAGYMALPDSMQYTGSKFGVRAMWKCIKLLKQQQRFGDAQVNVMCPTYILTNMTKDLAETLQSIGVKVGTTDDTNSVAMRCICDPEVDGRSLAVAAGVKEPGDSSFDLMDDMDTGDGNKVFFQSINDGLLGAIENFDGSRIQEGGAH